MVKYERAKDGYPIATTLCWDCANWCADCSWSKSFIPVPGWTAEPTVKFGQGERPISSFRVLDCPQFFRDSYVAAGRSFWLERGEQNDAKTESTG